MVSCYGWRSTVSSMPVEVESAGAKIHEIRDFFRSTLHDLEGLRTILRERLYALNLTDDVEFEQESVALAATLCSGEVPKTISADEYRRKYRGKLP